MGNASLESNPQGSYWRVGMRNKGQRCLVIEWRHTGDPIANWNAWLERGRDEEEKSRWKESHQKLKENYYLVIARASLPANRFQIMTSLAQLIQVQQLPLSTLPHSLSPSPNGVNIIRSHSERKIHCVLAQKDIHIPLRLHNTLLLFSLSRSIPLYVKFCHSSKR